MVRQPELEAMLAERAGELPSLSIERGAEATGLALASDAATLDVRAADGTARALCARYVVGCDGANSSVRGWIGSGWHDLGFRFDWLVVDVEPSDLRWD